MGCGMCVAENGYWGLVCRVMRRGPNGGRAGDLKMREDKRTLL